MRSRGTQRGKIKETHNTVGLRRIGRISDEQRENANGITQIGINNPLNMKGKEFSTFREICDASDDCRNQRIRRSGKDVIANAVRIQAGGVGGAGEERIRRR
jgi:hypothetical protein